MGIRSKKLCEPINIKEYKEKPYHKRICDLYLDNTPINRISTITGHTNATIKRHLKAAGIYKYTNINNNIKYKDNNIKDIKDIKTKDIKDNINLKKKDIISSKQNPDIVNNDNKQLNRIDSIINRLLSILDKKSVLVDMTTLQQVRALDQLVSKKVQLKDIINPNKNTNQVIINFINSREFKDELKEMATVKQKAIDVSAVE